MRLSAGQATAGVSGKIPKGSRTLNIDKLGARYLRDEVGGATVIWTARKPGQGPVIVGLYDDATVFRFMPPDTEDYRPFIAKAAAKNCRLLPVSRRTFDVIHKQKGFPGMAAAWFPGEHENGPAHDMLAAVSEYISTIRKFDPVERTAP
jgi:hypothetical protein